MVELSKCRGRPRKLSNKHLSQIFSLHIVEGVPIRKIADRLGVSHMTVWRALSRLIRGDSNGRRCSS